MIHTCRTHRAGFSLVEMAVVLGVIALILGFAVSLGSNAVSSANRVNTQERLETIRKAIENYVQNNGYYPCPMNRAFVPGANTNFGLEARSGTVCTASAPGIVSVGPIYIGGVPVRALGLPDNFAADAWGNKFTYAITAAAVSSANSVAESDPGINVLSGDRSGTNFHITSYTDRNFVPDGSYPGATTNGTGAIYALVSHGPDGKGAFPLNQTTVAIACASGNQNDAANCDDSDTIFYDSIYNDGDNEAQYFDDYIVWGSNSLNRSPINPAGPGACATGCEAWCAPCAGTTPNIPAAYTAFMPSGAPRLCKKIITSTTPCTATCVWSGKLTTGGAVVRCP